MRNYQVYGRAIQGSHLIASRKGEGLVFCEKECTPFPFSGLYEVMYKDTDTYERIRSIVRPICPVHSPEEQCLASLVVNKFFGLSGEQAKRLVDHIGELTPEALIDHWTASSAKTIMNIITGGAA